MPYMMRQKRRRKRQVKKAPDYGMPKQDVGNIGLYYVAYKLAQKGFRVFPTTRNAKGADMFVIDRKTTRKVHSNPSQD